MEHTKENGNSNNVHAERGHTHDSHTEHGHNHDSHVEHSHTHEEGKEHGHTHSHENKKAVMNRMARIIGHMQSVRTMIENDRDCSEVLIQLSAISSALQSVSRVVLKEHLSTCIVEAVREGDYDSIEELNAAIDKFMK